MKQFTVLSSRRAYYFAQDHIRLTALVTAEAQSTLTREFGFQAVNIASTSGAPFGPPIETMPPGLVCVWGQFLPTADTIIPIRYLGVDSTRVVIDVAGPSDCIDTIFQRFRSNIFPKLPDGSPLIGEPIKQRDQSDVTVTFEVDAFRIVPPAIARVLAEALGTSASQVGTLPPALTWQARSEDGVVPVESTFAANLGPRVGTRDADRITFSSAALDSANHRDYLVRLEAAMLELNHT